MRMKKLLVVGMIVLVAGCRSNDYSGPLNSFKRYPFKNIHLSYTFSGDARGTEDLYIADYGKYEARRTSIELLLPQGIRPKDEAGITRLSDVYNIDYIDKKVVHRRVTTLDSLYHLDESSIPKTDDYLQSSMKDYLFHSNGTEQIQGKAATLWEPHDGSMKLWVWNSLLLKKYAVSNNGTVLMDLERIDTNWTVDSSKFQVPTDGFEHLEDTKH
jgi:hypothetical protein